MRPLISPVSLRERMAAGVMGSLGGGREFWLRGLVPIRALSSPGPSRTPAGFSSSATSGGTRWASWAPASRLWAASLGDSSESMRLFIGLLGTRILMPVLDRSTLRRAEPGGAADIRSLPNLSGGGGWEELIEAGWVSVTGGWWSGLTGDFTWLQSPVTPALISPRVPVGSGLQGDLWTELPNRLGELRVERSNVVSFCRSEYWRLNSWT